MEVSDLMQQERGFCLFVCFALLLAMNYGIMCMKQNVRSLEDSLK